METINKLFTHLTSWVLTMSHPQGGLASGRLGRSRAVGMIEYVILAVIVLGFGLAFRGQIGAAISSLVDSIADFLGNRDLPTE